MLPPIEGVRHHGLMLWVAFSVRHVSRYDYSGSGRAIMNPPAPSGAPDVRRHRPIANAIAPHTPASPVATYSAPLAIARQPVITPELARTRRRTNPSRTPIEIRGVPTESTAARQTERVRRSRRSYVRVERPAKEIDWHDAGFRPLPRRPDGAEGVRIRSVPRPGAWAQVPRPRVNHRRVEVMSASGEPERSQVVH
jgi:hypothetical protein